MLKSTLAVYGSKAVWLRIRVAFKKAAIQKSPLCFFLIDVFRLLFVYNSRWSTCITMVSEILYK